MTTSFKFYSAILMLVVVLSCAMESRCQICGKTAYAGAPEVELYATINDHTSHSEKAKRFYNEILVQTDSNITLTCTAKEPVNDYPAFYSKYLQPYAIYWFVNSSFLQVSNCDETSRKVKTCSLSLNNISPRDHGKYSCKAVNQVGCTLQEIVLKVFGGKTTDLSKTGGIQGRREKIMNKIMLTV